MSNRLQVVETERRGVPPRAGLILERSGEARREERAFLADVLPDRGFDVPAPERVRWFLVRSHPDSSFVEMKVALSWEQESHCTFQGGNTSEADAGVPKRGKQRKCQCAGANDAPRRY